MKHSFLKTVLLSTAIAASASPLAMASSYSKDSNINIVSESTAISQLEATSLKFMREEEKLARDVYQALYDIWGTPIFKNIADSEQSHTNTVQVLLDKYNIEDPVVDNTLGIFTDPYFTKKYNELVSLGSESFENALRVGTLIEELDIADINEQLEIIKKKDITKAYSNLLKGSRNHLRGFYKLVLNAGIDYTPQFISQEEFDEIVNSAYETGNIN